MFRNATNLSKLFLKNNSKIINKNFFLINKQFSVSSKQNAIPPLFWIVIKPLSKVAAILAGRGFRTWFKTLRPHLTKTVVKEHLLRNKVKYGSSFAFVTIGGTVFYVTHLQTAPITNRKRFIIFLPFQIDEMEELSKSAMADAYGNLIVKTHTKDVTRILRVINRLVESNKNIEVIANTKWHLTLIDQDVINAAVFPSGHIIVFTGLLDSCRNDDELAAILGHELSHAILQHTAETLSRSRMIDVFSICLILTIWTIFPSDITAGLVHYFSGKFLDVALELPFNRFLETEADEVGMMLAAKACYDVRHIPLFWKRTQDMMPELLSTHPSNEHRAKELERYIPEAMKLRELCNCAKLPEKIDEDSGKYILREPRTRVLKTESPKDKLQKI